MIRFLTLFLFLSTSLGLTCKGQSGKQNPISVNDSIKIKNTCEVFYSWYGDIIKRKRLGAEFNPVFIKDKNGMTTLDFTKFKEGLVKHDFSDDFIKRRMNDYHACLENLETIPYETFATYQDLDQFEKIKCDIDHIYQWTNSMDSPDGAELLRLRKLNNNTIESSIRFFTKSSDGVKHYWGSATLTLIKLKVGWKINDIK